MSIAQRVEVTGIRPLRQDRKGGKEEGGEREIQAPRAGPNESFFFWMSIHCQPLERIDDTFEILDLNT